MADELRFGFAGLGEAATLVLPEITQLPCIRVTAAADVRPVALERFEAEYKGRTFRRVEELFASPDIDAVYIATPHELHAQHTLLALENRKHVIIEKPMALTVAEAQEMNQAAERHGVRLLCGHTKSFDPPIRKMRVLVREGRVGRLRMINTWNYNDFMVRPYPDRELETSRGVVLNQGPHQVDVVRLLGGGLVRSVRAMAAAWDDTRPEGAYSCYLEFEDGTPATIIFSGYGYFDTAELTWWLGEASYPGRNQDSRRAFNRIRGPERERRLEELKEGVRYGEQAKDLTAQGWGLSDFSHARGHQRFYGLTVVSGEQGEMRQSRDGILLYGDEAVEDIPVGEGLFGRQAEVTELYNAVVHGTHMFHDGRWGQATLEVCLGILQSAAERKEIMMSHQVPVGD